MSSKSKLFTFFSLLFLIFISTVEAQTTFTYRKLGAEEFVEMGRSDPEEDGLAHGVFILDAEGFEPNTSYTLFRKPLGGRVLNTGKCFTDDKGIMKLSDQQGVIDLTGMMMTLGNYMPGEPIEYILKPKNRKNKMSYTVKIIPNPLEVQDDEGRKISMEVITPDFETFSFRLSNFKPNEEIIQVSVSGGETIKEWCNVNKDGEFIIVTYPAVINKVRGIAKLRVMPTETQVPLEIKYGWGFPRERA